MTCHSDVAPCIVNQHRPFFLTRKHKMITALFLLFFSFFLSEIFLRNKKDFFIFVCCHQGGGGFCPLNIINSTDPGATFRTFSHLLVLSSLSAMAVCGCVVRTNPSISPSLIVPRPSLRHRKQVIYPPLSHSVGCGSQAYKGGFSAFVEFLFMTLEIIFVVAVSHFDHGLFKAFGF